MGGDSLRRGASSICSSHFTGGYSTRCKHACNPHGHSDAFQLILLFL